MIEDDIEYPDEDEDNDESQTKSIINIADMFMALEEFKDIIYAIKAETGNDLQKKRSLKIALGFVKKDIEAIFQQI